MTAPDEDTLIAALEATWPPRAVHHAGPWLVREGAGGGQRVSAATSAGVATPSDIPQAEDRMTSLGQRSLFMVRKHEDTLDTALAERGYRVKDPVTLYLAPADAWEAVPPNAPLISGWPPLELQKDLWLQDGIGPARIAVMERAASPKAALLLRDGQRAAATVFVSIAGKIAFIHALLVAREMRQRGFARQIMAAASTFAVRHAADWMALAVTRENIPANRLYQSLGMVASGGYHYRVKE